MTFSKIEKLKPTKWDSLNKASTLISLFQFLIPLAVSALIILFAYLTDSIAPLLKSYSPFSWVVVGVVGILISLIISLFITFIRKLWIEESIKKKFYDEKERINPLETVFKDIRIKIEDLIPPYSLIIENKTFINCELIGPANVAILEGCIITGCNGSLVDGIICENQKKILNAIAFKNCIFQNCYLFKLSFFIPSGIYETYSRGFPGLNWITKVPD